MSGPEKALKDFESAVNNRDTDGIIAILKPSEQSKFKLQLTLSKFAANLLGDFVGVGGLGDLFSDEVLDALLGVGLEDSYIEIRVISEEYNERQNKAKVTIEITMDDTTETETVEMVKISDKWYLDITLPDNFGSLTG